MSCDLTSASKFLSFLLRHDPGAIGLTLDREGWADIDALVDASLRSGRQIDRALVLEVVTSNDKKRFAVSDDGLRIHPALLHGGRVATYADHRMATAAAIIGLHVHGVTVEDIDTTAKTLPRFAARWTALVEAAR